MRTSIQTTIGAFTVIIAVLAAAFAARAQDEARYALVIGNADYAVGALKNPINDARSIAAVLLETGFETTVLENVNTQTFQAGLADFLQDIPEGAVGLFYYAGHAVQRDGRNYLLPVDIKPDSADSVVAQSVSATDVVEAFHASGVAFSIFILDACRDNPFTAGNEELGRGLASMESQGGETFIGFATQAGEVAYDGTGPNSPYTGALITALEQEGKDILDVFRMVRRSVRIWTDGLQRPFIAASIERRFEFRPRTGAAPTPIEIGELTFERVRAIVEEIWWDTIKDSKIPDDFRAFVSRYPESQRVALARNITVELEQTGRAVRGLELAQFSLDPERRSPVGLAVAITDCDITAGDPDDPRRVTDGVRWGLVNIRRALRDCSAALADDPDNPRLLHTMGRVLNIAGRFDEAEQFYRLAGARDYSAALVNLGYLYVAGQGRDRDYGQAMQLYRQAADLGNLRARTNIGEMFQLGWSVEPNLDEAVLWYRLAAQNGWPNALDTLANLYRRGKDDSGRGLDKDLDEAIRLYRVAAELGNSNAMNNLGTVYLDGDLGEPDVSRAVEWLTRAAESGNVYAPFNLGRMYRDGKVVERDFTLARELFERSADLGFAPARIALGRLYQNGDGVEKSPLEAGFHYTVAALTHDRKRPRQEEEALERFAKLGLSDADAAAVRARAEDWVRLNGG